MRLEQIVLHGFKSFAEKTEVRVLPGITCIVGPNGCGKSNVADAIRWALGEQSPKTLRGQKMEDVIFHGAASRKSIGMAEVGLIFGNDGSLGVPWSEVAVAAASTGRGERVPPEQDGVPPARHPGPVRRHRRQPEGVRAHGPGAAQPRAHRQAVGAADLHRGGRGDRPLQAAAGGDPGQARRHPAEPPARPRRDGRGSAAVGLARAPSPEGSAVQGAPRGAPGARPRHARRRLRNAERAARDPDARDRAAALRAGPAGGPAGRARLAAGHPERGHPGERVPPRRPAPAGAEDPGGGRAPHRASRAAHRADPGAGRGRRPPDRRDAEHRRAPRGPRRRARGEDPRAGRGPGAAR